MHLLVPNGLPRALLLEFVSDLGGSLLVVTGVLAGSFRTWAVLTKLPPVRIEWMTALGSAFGAMLMILFVVADQIWR